MSAIRTQQRTEVALKLTAHLAASEEVAEQSVRTIGGFFANLPDLREAASLSPTFGHDLYVEIASAMTGAVEMRGRLVRAHEILEAARKELRLPAMATVPGSDKPTDPGQNFAKLAAVA